MGRPRRRRDRQHGQILVLFELCFIAILGIAAIAVDLSVLRNDKQMLVNTMDAAALAGGSRLPVSGATGAANTKALIDASIKANYPSLTTSDYTIAYRCLIGANATGPLIVRDIPGVCDPHNALGHAPAAGDFVGAGPTRSSICNPSGGDTCNVVVVTGSATANYAFGPAVGVPQGSTGAVSSVACKGPCGAAAVVPVDAVIILDRTLSMAGSSGGADKITSLQNAAKAVLGVYNPAQQRVALALTGPSKIDNTTGAHMTSTCGGQSVYGVADNNNKVNQTTLSANVALGDTIVHVNTATGLPFPSSGNFTIAIDSEQMTVTGGQGTLNWNVTRPVNSTTKATHSSGATVYGVATWTPGAKTYGMWVPVGLSGTDTNSMRALPNPSGVAGTYTTGGVPDTHSDIVKAINCISAATDATDLATPIKMAQWYLDNYGRKDVTQGIILETDGHPQYGFNSGANQAGTNAAFTCQAAIDAATAAKADTTNSPDGIQIFTIGYGVDNTVHCPTKATSMSQDNGNYNMSESATWSYGQATTMLKTMATDSAHYFENPPSSQLSAVFTQAAIQLIHGGAHLIQLYPAPIVTGVSGGGTVTISGQYFTGVTNVWFGGAVAVFTPGTDTSFTATAPAGTSGTTVDVIVKTPGGISTITSADHYTYP